MDIQIANWPVPYEATSPNSEKKGGVLDAVIPVYNVGDTVRIIATPDHFAYVGWDNAVVSRYCGRETTIADRWPNDDAPGGFCYGVHADDRLCAWSADCFEENIPIEEINPDEAAPNINELLAVFVGT